VNTESAARALSDFHGFVIVTMIIILLPLLTQSALPLELLKLASHLIRVDDFSLQKSHQPQQVQMGGTGAVCKRVLYIYQFRYLYSLPRARDTDLVAFAKSWDMAKCTSCSLSCIATRQGCHLPAAIQFDYNAVSYCVC
jgi:hypothetical protein